MQLNPSEPLLAAALAEDLTDNRAIEGERPTADKTLLRGSDAFRCSRQIAFGALRIPRAIPLGTDTLMAFDAGRHHHTRLQGVLAQKFGAELEVPISYKAAGLDLSGHADAVYSRNGHKRVVEIKSMKRYPFEKATVRGEGPKTGDLIQGGIYALSPQLGADQVHVAYINKEDGALAEWLVDMEGEPVGPEGEDLRVLVSAELERLAGIAADIGAGFLPWRRIPGHGVVKHPPAPDSKDEPWNCRYCGWQPICAELPASKVRIAALGGEDR